jgi:hypothetical protein
VSLLAAWRANSIVACCATRACVCLCDVCFRARVCMAVRGGGRESAMHSDEE